MRSDDERLEYHCRLGLLAVAVLHWIVFALMVSSSDASLTDQAPRAFSNLASILLQHLPRI